MSELQPGLEKRLAHVKQMLSEAEEKAGRPQGCVKLLAVGKTFNQEALLECARAGALAFGENYAQEGCTKIDWFRTNHPELHLEWHFIGPLQANKSRMVAERFDWVQTVDRLRIAERLSAQRPDNLPPLNVLIEVNVDAEASKSGISPEELPVLAAAVSELPRLRLRGLMSIPAPAETYEGKMKPLLAMASLFKAFQEKYPQADTLSMGMSADLTEAVEAGSTMVRIGSAIFGPRNYSV